MIKLLVVDDSALLRKLLGQVFSSEADFEIEFARNGFEALDKLKLFKPDVITLDINMPELDGLACLDRIMIERPCPVVMVSSLTAEGAEATLEAFRLGAVDFVPKPEGAVSLRMNQLAPELVTKVRTAAQAKVRNSIRLKERVKHRIGATVVPEKRKGTVRKNAEASMTGEGLVVIGASTGGPPALEAVLSPLPSTFPWPIVVAQHMPASFTGPLAKRLNNLCSVAVTEVTRPVRLQPGAVYIARGDADLLISRRPAGLVALSAPAQKGYPWHPSTDRLVRSAMDCLPPSQIIGILLTGMGYDGAPAMATLHAAGGRTIAEAEETAVVWGMPGELVKAEGADWILPLPAIADRLLRLSL